MPVSISRLRELLELAGSGGVEGIDIVENGSRIRIIRNGSGQVQGLAVPTPQISQPVPAAPDRDILVSPMFGVLHLTPAPGAKPFVEVGDRIAKGQQIGLIEAMKMFNVVYSDRDGRLEDILVQAGTEVVTGQPLLRIVGN